MVKYLVAIIVVLLLVSCGISSRLSRKYDGKGLEILYGEMGKPKTITNLDDGNRLFVFEKSTFIKETNIGTGSFALDPRVSPSFIKIETYKFIIDGKGIVVNSSYEKKVE